MYKIEISKAVNGIIMVIGCRTYVNNDIDYGCRELARFLKDPERVEKEYAGKYPDWESTAVRGSCVEAGADCEPGQPTLNNYNVADTAPRR